jgi:phosphate transport system substrate-binding protein
MKKSIVLAVTVVAGASLTGIGSAASAQNITAVGASFPAPIYERWFQAYGKAHPAVQINYQGPGSGAGIKQLTEGTIDFGASDMPMKDAQIAAIKVKPLHFPTVLGGVVLTYNLPGVSQDLKFSPELIADIFLGKITSWTDARIAKENPGVKIPKLDILVVHRSDSSGTTFVFTDYLAKVSSEWKSKVGAADTAVKWPTGSGAGQNAGVAGMVKQTEGAIGYVELIYALKNNMSYAWIKNSSGTYLKPTLETVTAAAAGVAKEMPADFRVSITNAPGKNAYPISTFTYLLIPSEIKDSGKKQAIVDFLKWMLTSGEKDVTDHPDLGFAPLPKPVIDKETKQIALIK